MKTEDRKKAKEIRHTFVNAKGRKQQVTFRARNLAIMQEYQVAVIERRKGDGLLPGYLPPVPT